jgi:predicted RNA binding protein YcfA (HicA-like mRNA interferase family)
MPKKIRELKTILLKAGFTYRQAKGSHTFWTHTLIPDAPRYLEKQVNRVLEILKEIQQLKETEEE